VDQRAHVQIKADKYRRYVRLISDPEIVQEILSLASELERQAMQPDEEDIRTRAYDLWREAGEPENRDEEFWLLAEQELRNEDKSLPLRAHARQSIRFDMPAAYRGFTSPEHTMPRYFFNITQWELPRPLDKGMELPNDEAAWEEATTTCGEMIKELDGKLKTGPECGWK
jgi:hypothetical protein